MRGLGTAVYIEIDVVLVARLFHVDLVSVRPLTILRVFLSIAERVLMAFARIIGIVIGNKLVRDGSLPDRAPLIFYPAEAVNIGAISPEIAVGRAFQTYVVPPPRTARRFIGAERKMNFLVLFMEVQIGYFEFYRIIARKVQVIVNEF